MNYKGVAFAGFLCLIVSPLFAQPELNVVPGGIQGGNFVWDVSITPDLELAGTGTPVAFEIGYRLTGAPLISATNINPIEYDFEFPGIPIFGWETVVDVDPGPGEEFRAEGLQTNLATGEIFTAFGTAIFETPGPSPFMRIVARGPDNGGPSLSSMIEWLGVYAMGQGRIAQLVSPTRSENFDIFSGTATQAIAEPTSAALCALGIVMTSFRVGARCSGRATSG